MYSKFVWPWLRYVAYSVLTLVSAIQIDNIGLSFHMQHLHIYLCMNTSFSYFSHHEHNWVLPTQLEVYVNRAA